MGLHKICVTIIIWRWQSQQNDHPCISLTFYILKDSGETFKKFIQQSWVKKHSYCFRTKMTGRYMGMHIHLFLVQKLILI